MLSSNTIADRTPRTQRPRSFFLFFAALVFPNLIDYPAETVAAGKGVAAGVIEFHIDIHVILGNDLVGAKIGVGRRVPQAYRISTVRQYHPADYYWPNRLPKLPPFVNKRLSTLISFDSFATIGSLGLFRISPSFHNF